MIDRAVTREAIRRRRRRGRAMWEVIAASGLAVVFLGTYAAEVARQHRELAHGREVARAASVLRDVHERALGGALVAPPPGEALALEAPAGMTLTVRRAPTPDEARLEGLVPVLVRAEWRGRDGRPTARELVTLAPARAGEGGR